MSLALAVVVVVVVVVVALVVFGAAVRVVTAIGLTVVLFFLVLVVDLHSLPVGCWLLSPWSLSLFFLRISPLQQESKFLANDAIVVLLLLLLLALSG